MGMRVEALSQCRAVIGERHGSIVGDGPANAACEGPAESDW
jgi:hypothetical protein